eukprot:scaffold1042_cov401-Prasinococcus_capsulatus_cf.AAC.34
MKVRDVNGVSGASYRLADRSAMPTSAGRARAFIEHLRTRQPPAPPPLQRAEQPRPPPLPARLPLLLLSRAARCRCCRCCRSARGRRWLGREATTR